MPGTAASEPPTQTARSSPVRCSCAVQWAFGNAIPALALVADAIVLASVDSRDDEADGQRVFNWIFRKDLSRPRA